MNMTITRRRATPVRAIDEDTCLRTLLGCRLLAGDLLAHPVVLVTAIPVLGQRRKRIRPTGIPRRRRERGIRERGELRLRLLNQRLPLRLLCGDPLRLGLATLLLVRGHKVLPASTTRVVRARTTHLLRVGRGVAGAGEATVLRHRNCLLLGGHSVLLDNPLSF